MLIDKLADLLIGYSTAVRPGDVVCLVSTPRAGPLLAALHRRVLGAGGHPVPFLEPEFGQDLLHRHGSPDQLAFVNPLERHVMEEADVLVHVLTASDLPDAGPGDLAGVALRDRARRPLLERFCERVAAKSLRWAATQFPCPAAARNLHMTWSEYQGFFARAALLDRPDPAAAWKAVSARQARLIEHLSRARELRFVTPAGTDVSVEVAGRTWSNGDGHENVPDGEVWTAPHEDATDGVVCFDFPRCYAGRAVRGVRLEFRTGRVVGASAAEGEDALFQLLDLDPGARALGEVGLGCNYALARPAGHPLFDEKIGGTFHLALGMPYPGNGGRNRSAIHWDLVADLRRGGRVLADGRVIAEDGRFVNAEWPQTAV